MTKKELESKLDSTLENFKNETNRLNEYGKSPVSEGDLADCLNQVFYALNDFKKNLLEYLD